MTRGSPAALRSPTATELPGGGGGGWFEPTMPVAFEIAEVEPRSFLAMTRTRIVRPVSLSRISYSGSLAPWISLQLSPLSLQRSQTNEQVIGSSPPPRPRFALRAAP